MTLLLIAHVAGQAIAIAAEQIDSVVDIGTVVPVPRTNPAVRGLTALRSRVVTVVDTGLALGLPATPADARRAVITQLDGHLYAVLVDAVEDVGAFEPGPLVGGLTLGGGWHAVGTGMVEHRGEPVLIVDLAMLVPMPAAA